MPPDASLPSPPPPSTQRARVTPAVTVRSQPGRGASALRDSASAVPLIVGASAVGVSLILAIIGLANSTPTVLIDRPRFSLPLESANLWWAGVVGYLLTPIVVIGARGWDTVAQRRGLQNRNFVLKPGYSKVLGALLVAGCILALWQLLNVSLTVASLFSAGAA